MLKLSITREKTRTQFFGHIGLSTVKFEFHFEHLHLFLHNLVPVCTDNACDYPSNLHQASQCYVHSDQVCCMMKMFQPCRMEIVGHHYYYYYYLLLL